MKFDAGQAGGVRIGNTASKVSNCSPSYAGVMAYVHVGGKSGFCGCNGQTWVPLTADPSIQAVCINMQKSPCAGSQPLNANKGAEIHLPLWDPNANNGDGAFMPKNWMYTNASPKAECTYDCQIGYHPGQNNPEGKHLDGACKACSSIDRRYTAGAHNGWKTAGKGNDDCDFSCVGGSFYKNTASQRACPLCSTGKSVSSLVSKISGNTHYDKAWYSPDDNQLATCSECTNKPVNAKYTQKDVNSATGACPWECADGFNRRNDKCRKANWEKEKIGSTCDTSSGKWGQANEEYTYVCKDSGGVVVSNEAICGVWRIKPQNEHKSVNNTGDYAHCNRPTWTSRSCETPNCQGKCSRDTVNVTCTKSKRDPAGHVYETMTEQQPRQCTGDCNDGTCGAAAQPTKTKPTSNLCAAGSRLQGSVSTNSDGWRWTCKGEHGTTSCFAPKQALQAGACNANVNGVNVNWADGSWPSNTTLCSYGTVIEKNFNTNPNVYLNKWSWKCEGDVGASKASCAAHKPNTNAWRCDQNRINSCVKLGELNPKAGKPVSGFENGKQWKCENEGNISDVYCTKCNDGYLGTVYDQNQPAQCVKPVQNVKVCFNPQGYREHNGWTSCM